MLIMYYLYKPERYMWKFSLLDMLAALGTFGAFIVATLEYRKSRLNSPDYRAARAYSNIQTIIDNLVERIPNLSVASIAAVSNGGGVPLEGRPLFMRVLLSTDTSTIETFEQKFLMESALVNAHSQMMFSGDTIYLKEQMKRKSTIAWYCDKGIIQTHQFFIGMDPGRDVFVLLCNFKTAGVVPHSEYLLMLEASKRICKIFKRRRLWGLLKLPLRR